VTMVNCRFIGFRQALNVWSKAQVSMKDCMVDFSTGQAYSADLPVVRNSCQWCETPVGSCNTVLLFHVHNAPAVPGTGSRHAVHLDSCPF
jgi:hypothetical protein